MDLPAGFVRYYERDDLAEAMNADGLLMKIQRHDNYHGGELPFWGKLARRSLVENRSLAVETDEEIKLNHNRGQARLITGRRDLGGKPNGYLLAIAAEKKKVYTIEVWGDADAFTRELPTLKRALQTIRP